MLVAQLSPLPVRADSLVPITEHSFGPYLATYSLKLPEKCPRFNFVTKTGFSHGICGHWIPTWYLAAQQMYYPLFSDLVYSMTFQLPYWSDHSPYCSVPQIYVPFSRQINWLFLSPWKRTPSLGKTQKPVPQYKVSYQTYNNLDHEHILTKAMVAQLRSNSCKHSSV
jgi:hypothetical protein